MSSVVVILYVFLFGVVLTKLLIVVATLVPNYMLLSYILYYKAALVAMVTLVSTLRVTNLHIMLQSSIDR